MIKGLRNTTIYLIIISVFLLSVNLFLGYMLTTQSDTAMRTLIENRMLDVSNTAAAMLDGDALRVIQADDVETPEYQSVLKTLSYFQNNIDLEYIYCIRDMGNDLFVFTIDPSDDPGEFGEPVVSTEALRLASQGTPSVDKVPYGDRWGRFYSAYTPVYDSKHQITGIVAVDFSAEWYEKEIADQVKTTVKISAISLIIACITILFIGSRYKKQFQYLIKEMNEVSNGIETLVREVSPETSMSKQQGEEKADTKNGIEELSNQIQSLQNRLSGQISYVRSLAYMDGLTGLGNRTAYEEQVGKLDDEAKTGKARFGVILFDLNGLKGINDQQGHEQGDQAIVMVASILKKVFDDCKIYRIGGDEFVVLMEGSCDDVEIRIKAVDAQLELTEGITVAKGFSEYLSATDDGYREVFKRADNAMYFDKKAFYKTHQDRRK